jgi:tetratricopeptide (TPR) repeat protein
LLGVAPAWLGGCAWLAPPRQTAALAASPPASLPPRRDLDAVPFFAQTPYHCGPAALATVLVHAGFAASPEALGEQVFLPAREGSLQLEMLAGARRAGALAVRLPGELGALLQEVAAGQPVVVLQNLGLSFAPRWHYAVLVGYELEAQRLLLRSGTVRREGLSFTPFEHTWARGGHWAFAVSRPGQLPITTREADATEAALGFERANPSSAARAAVYDSLLVRWPHNLVARIGQGNARAAQGDWAGAATSFQQAAERHDSAAAWHNLGLALLQTGQREAARSAAQRALARAGAAEPAWRDAAQKLVELTSAP